MLKKSVTTNSEIYYEDRIKARFIAKSKAFKQNLEESKRFEELKTNLKQSKNLVEAFKILNRDDIDISDFEK